MLKIRPFAAFPPRGFMLQILWNIVVFCSVLTLSDGKFPSPQGSIFRIVAGKKPVWKIIELFFIIMKVTDYEKSYAGSGF